MQVALIWGKRRKQPPDGHRWPSDGGLQVVPASLHCAGWSTKTPRSKSPAPAAAPFHIGTVSLMSADNVQGFRPDTIALMHEVPVGLLASAGRQLPVRLELVRRRRRRDKRPPMFDYAWNAMQTNDVGMDEFMTLCKLIGIEPYISVNAGFGDCAFAAEEVEYMNGSATRALARMRARNGHPEPYHIKFWNIGNEP